jgi:hypothetical protein
MIRDVAKHRPEIVEIEDKEPLLAEGLSRAGVRVFALREHNIHSCCQ